MYIASPTTPRARDPALKTNKQMNKKTNKIKPTEADNFYSALEYIS